MPPRKVAEATRRYHVELRLAAAERKALEALSEREVRSVAQMVTHITRLSLQGHVPRVLRVGKRPGGAQRVLGIQLRLSPGLFRRLQERAANNERSVAAYVTALVLVYLGRESK